MGPERLRREPGQGLETDLAQAPGIAREARWTERTGVWFGVGASPGALLTGAALAEAHDGPLPLLAVTLGVTLVGALLWFQGLIGLAPPVGDGGTLNQVTPRYFGPLMQRLLAAVMALAMIGWYGFNVGLGGAAISALLRLPGWLGPLLIGLPVLWLSLKGMSSWNALVTLATMSALLLVALVTVRLGARQPPLRWALGNPAQLAMDVAALIGFVAVFSVRAPDFSAHLARRRDLALLVGLFCVTMTGMLLAGVGLQQETGSADLVGILAGPGGLAIGNLLVAIAMVAPSFATLFSGAPALQAVTGLDQRWAMVAVTVTGLFLAVVRFDRLLLPWLKVLAAMLPPLTMAMATEAAARRRGRIPRLVPVWSWLPGSLAALALTTVRHSLASLAGLGITGLALVVWWARGSRMSASPSEAAIFPTASSGCPER